VNLHDQDVRYVKMWLERTALEKTQIGVHFCIDSHLSLDGRAKLTDLRNRAVDIVRNDADTLRQQVVKSANVELLVFVRCVEHAGDLYAVPHDPYVLVKRVLGQEGIDVTPREQRFRPSRVGSCDVETFKRVSTMTLLAGQLHLLRTGQ